MGPSPLMSPSQQGMFGQPQPQMDTLTGMYPDSSIQSGQLPSAVTQGIQNHYGSSPQGSDWSSSLGTKGGGNYLRSVGMKSLLSAI